MPPRLSQRPLLFLAVAVSLLGRAAEFPEPFNSEKPGLEPMPAAQAAASFALPEGFHISVFAAEPDVRQPIAMTTDARGRLWVAENYTYAESKVNFATQLNDRVIILEDTNHDGKFDRRTVFWDQAKILTSIEVGRGGVFALCPPRLLFLPDRNGKDRPDGEPEVLLDGFTTTTGNRHTFANGLKWGPDGWLWGRIGISSGARIGRPGSDSASRTEMRGGIWRYHPERKVFEAVCHGTTNPWGLDWNEVGEPFFINTVIGHLWHAIPGAHFRRMHGDDVNSRAYTLIDQHADHYHFDTGAGWTKSRAAMDGSTFATGSDALGGGHAHAGLMIYQGDNWPAEYRGEVLTLNLHGRRINRDHLDRAGTGYIGRHRADFMQVGDPWFRGLDLIQGPDGGVFISDWSDTGECHDSDGVHRTSGRIYKVTHGAKPGPVIPDLAALPDAGLIGRVSDPNEWISRQARQILADRAASGRCEQQTGEQLRARFEQSTTVHDRLRFLWAANAVGGAPVEWLARHLTDSDEHISSWMVRLIADRLPIQPDDSVPKVTVALAKTALNRFAAGPHPPLVRLYLASALQRMPPAERIKLADALLGPGPESTDHNFPLLLWYGLEPLIAARPEMAPHFFSTCSHRLVRQYIARRLAEDLQTAPDGLNGLLALMTGTDAAMVSLQQDLLRGVSEALRGLRKCPPPARWNAFAAAAATRKDPEVTEKIRDLGVVFGDGRATDDLRRIVADPAADGAARRNALTALVEARVPNLGPLLRSVISDGALRPTALLGLLQTDDPEGAARVVSNYPWLGLEDRPAILAAMVTRPAGARSLLDAMAAGSVPRSDLTAFHARQIAALADAGLTRQLTQVWGVVRAGEGDHRSTITRFRTQMTPGEIARANLQSGRQTFQQLCTPCHRLHGAGGEIGPDLTGSGRSNLDYLLENIIDPGAIVPAGYRLTTVTMTDGRTLAGLMRDENDRTFTLQAPGQTQVIDRREVKQVETSNQSMMPEGLLEGLSMETARNLLAYLMHPGEVPAAAAR